MRKTGRRSWPHVQGIFISPFGQVYTRSPIPISHPSSAARTGGNLNVVTLASRTIVERLVDETQLRNAEVSARVAELTTELSAFSSVPSWSNAEVCFCPGSASHPAAADTAETGEDLTSLGF